MVKILQGQEGKMSNKVNYTPVIDCSLVNLIATPQKYHNQKVRVVGFAVKEFEEQALYLSEIDAREHISQNGVWLSLEDATVKTLKPKMLNRKYVIVMGIFDMNMYGHGALNAGGIKQIERLDRWEISK